MGYTWSLMTEFQQDIINNFHNLVKKHQLVCDHKSFIDAHYAYDVYSVPYSSIMNLFISELTGLNKSLISQYVAAQQFFFLLSDSPVIDVKVCLHVYDNFVSVEFKKFVDVKSDFENPAFLKVLISTDDKINFSSCHGDLLLEPLSFVSAYNCLLQDITNITNPTINSFKKTLELSNKNTINVLNEKLNRHHIKAISVSEFSSFYLNNPDIEYSYNSYINLSERIFMSFLKDNFPINIYSKIRNIVSVSLFQEKICKRSLDWHTLTDFNIVFPNVSKYSELNNIYKIIFSVMPYDDYRCTLDVYDDGTISFCYCLDEDVIKLTDLDDIYNYLKEGLISSIEKTLDIERKYIRTSHFKLYEMILL